jgi:hypothetical protein
MELTNTDGLREELITTHGDSRSSRGECGGAVALPEIWF